MTGPEIEQDSPAPISAILRNVRLPGMRLPGPGIDLVLRDRARLAVIGAPGAGKSALLLLLAGRLRGWTGSAFILCEPLRPDRRPPRRLSAEIGHAGRDPALVPRASLLRNVLLGRLGRLGWLRGALGRFGPADLAAAEAALAETGLLAHAEDKAEALPQPLLRRAALARALAQDPRLLVVEEPDADQDPLRAEGTLRLLGEGAARRRAALVFSSAHPDLALRHAEVVLVLREGRVIHSGPAAETNPRELSALLGGQAGPRGSGLRLVV